MLKKFIKGQSLVEMVVVIAVTGIALVGVTYAATLSVRNSRVARERAEARNFAYAVIEDVRRTRNTDPETFFIGGSRTETLTPVGENPVYQREVIYQEVVAMEQYLVQVRITWAEGGSTFSVVEETTFERYLGN